ncbi:glycosyltransferase [Actinomyces oricola]
MTAPGALDLGGRAHGIETLAVLVSAGVTPYLPSTLRALARQTHAPEVVLVVDVASRDNGLGDGSPVEEAVELSGLDAVSDVRIVRVANATSFGGAVTQGMERYAALITAGNRRRLPTDSGATSVATGALARPGSLTAAQLTGPTGALSPITASEKSTLQDEDATGEHFLWLLHDDSAPEPTCLKELVSAAAEGRSVALVGPKQVDWDNPEILLEVGLRTTASARRANDIVPGEIDQGQHDDRSDVLAVGTAGAFVDRAVWEQVGGTSPYFAPFGDGLELSRAVRLAGYRVVVAPKAVVRHRRASYLGVRVRGTGARRTKAPLLPDPDRSYRPRRIAQLTAWATFSTRPVGLLLTWFMLLGLVRTAWRLLSKEPALARDEFIAALRVASRPARIRQGRRRLAAFTAVPRTVVAELYLDPAQIRVVRRDRARQERERVARAQAPSELELRELQALARRRRWVLAAVLLVALALGLVGMSSVIVARSLTGGALVSLGQEWRQNWDAAWATWAASGDGYPATLTPFLAVLALPQALGGLVGLTGDSLVHLLLLLALPLGAAGAWAAAGTITRRTSLRAWAALVWALSPTLLLAVGQGRLAAVLVHLVLPWALTALARAVGADRRDLVLSGLVGAHQLTDEERAELERFAHERIEDLGVPEDEEGLPDEDKVPEDQEESGDQGGASGDEPEGQNEGHKEPSRDSGQEAQDTSATGTRARASAPGPGAHAADPGPDTAEKTGAGAAGDSRHGSAEPSSPAPGAEGAGDAEGFPKEGVEADGAADEAKESASPEEDGNPAEDDDEDDQVPADDPRVVAIRTGTAQHYGPGSPTAAAVAGLLLTAIVAAAPATAAVVIPALLVLMVASWRSAPRLLLTLAPVVATAAPSWWRAWHIWASTGRLAAAQYLLTDPGAPLSAPAPSVMEMLLGLPQDLDSILTAPLLALAAKAVLALVPVLAVAGLLLSGRYGARARMGFLGAAGALALALAAARLPSGVGPAPGADSAELATAWPGTAVSLLLAGLLTSALAAADAARSALVRHPTRGLRLTLTVMSVLALAGPLAAGGAWALAAAGSDAQGRAASVMALRAGGQQIPIIASEIQRSGAAGRVLVLTSTDSGLEVSLWRGEGTLLADTIPAVTAAQLAARTDTGPLSLGGPASDTTQSVLLDQADAELATIVASGAAGQDEAVADQLAAHGIAVVLLADRPGDETTALVKAGLDATPGLEQLTQTAAGISWRVTPSTGAEPARAALVDDQGRSTTLPWRGTRLTATVPAAQPASTLVLAERADPAWRATLNGQPLQAATVPGPEGTWRQAFTVPAGGGELVVTHEGTTATMAPAIWVTWGLVALASLPLRRRRISA